MDFTASRTEFTFWLVFTAVHVVCPRLTSTNYCTCLIVGEGPQSNLTNNGAVMIGVDTVAQVPGWYTVELSNHECHERAVRGKYLGFG